MLYTEKQWANAQEILNECFTDYMAYVDSIGTMLEGTAEEYDLPNHLQAKLDIIKEGMMKYQYFTDLLGEDFESYVVIFKTAFSHWLDNKYLHHLSLLGYATITELDEDEREELNRKGRLLIEVTNAIAVSLNIDGTVPICKYETKETM